MRRKIAWRWKGERTSLKEGWVQMETAELVAIGDREWSSCSWFKKDEIEIFPLEEVKY